ncbi:hypothetical protein OROMI_033177 [Orobanche minor]
MSWRGSVSRSLMSTARASAFRSSTPLSAPRRLRSRSVPSSRLNSRLTLGVLGCAQSLMPVMESSLTSYLACDMRAFCERAHVVLEYIVGPSQPVLDADLGT